MLWKVYDGKGRTSSIVNVWLTIKVGMCVGKGLTSSKIDSLIYCWCVCTFRIGVNHDSPLPNPCIRSTITLSN